MNFLFETSIHDFGKELHFNVYQFKLHPQKYKAALLGESKEATKEIIFWKDGLRWKTGSKDHEKIAQVIGGY